MGLLLIEHNILRVRSTDPLLSSDTKLFFNNKYATRGMAMPCFVRLVSFVLKIVPECSSGSRLFGEGRTKDGIFRFT